MEPKVGLLFWLVVAGTVLIGSLQKLAVEGLTCDICDEIGNDTYKEVACEPQMPCNSYDEMKATWDVLQEHKKADGGAAGSGAQLASRQNGADKGGKYVCVKSVGPKSESDHLQGSCMTDVDKPPARDEPYDGSDARFFNQTQQNGFQGLKVYICNETNTDACLISKVEVSRANARYPPHDGLMCSICKVSGRTDTGPCEPMPCNTMEQKIAADKFLEEKGARKRKKRDEETKVETTNPNPTSFSCVKVLGVIVAKQIITRRLPYVYGYCSASMPNYPPKPDPYPNKVPGDIEAFKADLNLLKIMQGTFEPKTFYVCDKTNEIKCHISEEERKPEGSETDDGKNPNQGGTLELTPGLPPVYDNDDSTSGTVGESSADGKPKKTTTTGPGGTGGAFGLAPTATFWLLFFSKLIKYYL